jgi:murein DD-endopeptidase MepM/ murein hydrolase activator NlpD
LTARVAVSGYEAGDGNYEAHVFLLHESPYFQPFYSLYGHLNRVKLPAAGQRFTAGEVFAFIGDFHENGN